jgi:eukaryotic-like serine/threonine-protein kinase
VIESSGAPKRRRRARAAYVDWVFAVALAFFVGVAVWFGRSIYDFLTPSAGTLSTPTFVGQAEGDAITEAQRLRIRVLVVARAPSDKFPVGVVMNQQPGAGSQIREGRQVSLIVSTGLQLFPMPDLRYESMREVNLDLSHYRLTLGKTRLVSNNDVPAGHVVAQDPAPLTSARIGTVVNLDVSKGGQSSARVPSFVDLTIDEARQEAADAGVHLGQVVWTPFGRSGAARGLVVRQEPSAGERMDPFTTVSLQVSAGPGQAGYLVRQVHAAVTVPSSDGPQLVRITVRDDTGSWNVYNAYAESRQKLDFNLTVVGTSELDTYVNNELLGSTQLGSEPPTGGAAKKKAGP